MEDFTFGCFGFVLLVLTIWALAAAMYARRHALRAEGDIDRLRATLDLIGQRATALRVEVEQLKAQMRAASTTPAPPPEATAPPPDPAPIDMVIAVEQEMPPVFAIPPEPPPHEQQPTDIPSLDFVAPPVAAYSVTAPPEATTTSEQELIATPAEPEIAVTPIAPPPIAPPPPIPPSPPRS